MAGRISGITIEIDGDTSKLGKALKDTNKEIRDTQSQLREVERGLKFQPGNTELLGQKFKLLNTQVDETKAKLKTLQEADKQAKQQLANGEIGQDQYDALRREIIKTEDQLKSLEKKAEETQKALKGQGWTEAGKKLEDFGGKLTKVGDSLTKKVTTPIAGIGAASAVAWHEIDDAIDGIITATGKTGDELETLKSTFDNVFSSMPVSADEVGAAIGELDTQFGETIGNLDQATESALQFAKINNADVVTSIQGAKKSMEMFGLQANDLESALDVVSLAAQNTGVSSDKIFESMRANAPILKDMGIGYHESALMIAEMEKSGLDADKVLSGLQKGQINAAKSGKTLTDVVGSLQTAMDSGASRTELLAMAAELFGTRNAPIMIAALQSGVLDLEGFAAAAEQAGGTVSNTFESTIDPIDQAKIALNNLKLLGAELFNAIQTVLGPYLEKIVESIKGAVEWFKSLSPEMQNLIVKIGLLAAAAGPILSLGGRLIGGIGKMMQSIGALGGAFNGLGSLIGTVFSPTGLIIGGVIAAAALIISHWDDIKAAAQKLGEKISETWNNIKNWTSEKWNNIKDTVSRTWDGIKTSVSTGVKNVADKVSSTWDNIKTWTSDKWNGVKDSVSKTWDNLKSSVTEGSKHIADKVSTTWGNIKSWTSEKWDNVKSTVSDAWSNMKNNASSGAQNIFTRVSTAWSNLRNSTNNSWNNIKSSVTSIWGGMRQGAVNGANSVATSIARVWDGLKNTTHNAFEAIKNVASRGWQKTKDLANAAMNTLTGKGSGGGGSAQNAGSGSSAGGGGLPTVQGMGIGVSPSQLSWYDQGGIFTGPSVIGVAEKRPEAVGALEDIKSIFLDAMREFVGQAQSKQPRPVLVTGNSFSVREEADINRIADALYRKYREAERSF